MIRYICLHCRCNALRLMNTNKIIIKEMQSKICFQVLKFLGIGVSESSKSTHLHSHGQVLAFNVTGGNMFSNRFTDKRF